MMSGFDNFKEGLNLAKSIYKEGVDELGFNKNEAFGFLYEEISYYLEQLDLLVKFKAFTALFYLAYVNKINLIYDANDFFSDQIFNELKQVYFNFFSDETNLKNAPDIQDAESQKIIEIVKYNYVNQI